jgi:hypothetical protein
MWYIYPVEYYLPIKRDEIMSFERKWIELENTTLSKISQVQKDEYHMTPLICRI